MLIPGSQQGCQMEERLKWAMSILSLNTHTHTVCDTLKTGLVSVGRLTCKSHADNQLVS